MIYVNYKYDFVNHNYYVKLPRDKAKVLCDELSKKPHCEWARLVEL